MPELDSLRRIAILLVLFYHGFGLEYGVEGLSGTAKVIVAATLWGWVGVDLFFVLSGFLITGILLDTKQRPDYYRRFYIRRALRILPIYYAVLAVLAITTRTRFLGPAISWSFLGDQFPFSGEPCDDVQDWSFLWRALVTGSGRTLLPGVADGGAKAVQIRRSHSCCCDLRGLPSAARS